MPDSAAQLALMAVELALLFGGGGLLIWVLGNPRMRQRWFGHHPLPHWPVSLSEFLVFCMVVLLGGFFFQLIAQLGFADRIASSPDKAGLEILIYGFGMHGGIVLGYFMFPILRRGLYFNYHVEPAAFRDAPPLPWPYAVRYAVGVLLVALPVLTILSLGWTTLLRAAGLSDQPQDLIAIFGQTKSTLVVVGMLVVACGLAPLSEELLFRAGLYRFCRQNHMGSISVVCIGLMLWALSLIYQASGRYSSSDLTGGLTLTLYGALLIGSAGIIFRYGSSNNFVERNKRPIALILNSCLFGFLHGNWAGFLPLAVLGMILALAYEATGSIRVAIGAHALFNLHTVLIVLSGLPQASS